MWLREDDGSISELDGAMEMPVEGLVLCIRADGTRVMATLDALIVDPKEVTP